MASLSIGTTQESLRALYPSLPFFDGFPYLVTRVVPAMYHISLLLQGAGELELAVLSRTQWRANRFDVCLVLGEQRALYLSADGIEGLDTMPPRGGIVMCGSLRAPSPWPNTSEPQARQRRLDAFIDEHSPKKGYSLGDLRKGGRDATADDVARLAGAGPEGAPRGLERCVVCHEWHGVCLDQSARFFCKVMKVHCCCQNDNRCAACGAFLYERKLNANFYSAGDHQIWHVPGFSGLSHRCSTSATKEDTTL